MVEMMADQKAQKMVAVKVGKSDWFGQKELIIHETNIGQKNWFFEFSGKKIAIIFNDKFNS